jgi:hypothetical protein
MELMDKFGGSIDSIANALTLLGGKATEPSESKAKVKEPDVFDGSDPRKLKEFLVSLSLVFVDRPSHFTDQKKVMYALSYLGGSAREWFVPDILDPNPTNPPAWMNSFSALVRELQDHFGLFDAQGEAEDRLGNIRMKENEQVRKYNTRFNTLAAMTGWDDIALKWAYQRGLATRIKDEMVHGPTPATLSAYRAKVLEIDNRYWRREEERKREVARTSGGGSGGKTSSPTKKGSPNSSSQNNSSQNSGWNKPNNNPQGSGQQPKKPWNNNKPAPSGSGFNKSASSASSTPKPYANLLGADGRLKPSEVERRKKANLCMICGSNRHKADSCDKKRSGDSRGRAASTEESATNPTDTGPEK